MRFWKRTARFWTSRGTPYESGTRYKEVTPEEVVDYELNVALPDGRPLYIKWASSENNTVLGNVMYGKNQVPEMNAKPVELYDGLNHHTAPLEDDEVVSRGDNIHRIINGGRVTVAVAPSPLSSPCSSVLSWAVGWICWSCVPRRSSAEQRMYLIMVVLGKLMMHL